MVRRFCFVALAATFALFHAQRAAGALLTTSYTDGGTWNTVYGQGFSASVAPNPNPGLSAGDTVYLDEVRFYKSGAVETVSNIQLMILNDVFTNLQGMNTSWAVVSGLSTNTIANTSGLNTGDAIAFDFNNLPVTYGNDYAAIFVNVGTGGELTPIRVSALTANYQDVGGGDYHPATNYGTESEYRRATTNFITTNEFGQFFNMFSYAGDANFTATFNTVPEPACIGLCGVALTLTLRARRRRD